MIHNSLTSSLSVNIALELYPWAQLGEAKENTLGSPCRRQPKFSSPHSPLIANPDTKGGLSRG